MLKQISKIIILSGLVLISSGCATETKPDGSVEVAQQTADEAKRLAIEAKQAADEAKDMAAQAQATADAANEKAERMFKKSMSK